MVGCVLLTSTHLYAVCRGATTLSGFDLNPNKYSLLMHCIKIKSPAKSLLNEQYVFVGGNVSFLCVLSCSSQDA